MKDKLAAVFAQRYGRQPATLTRAPGRLEILGNHTDYNEGFVISCAVDRSTWFAAAPTADATGTCRVYDARDDVECCFRVPEVGAPQPGDWSNYIKGVIVQLQRRGVRVPAFYGAIISTIPMSSGVSSSAALEIAVAYGLGALVGAHFEPAEWARIGQGCENDYVGAKTGLLDQFSSIMGRRNHLVFSDFRTLSVRTVPFPDDAVFVMANSGVKHDLTQEYNERRQHCEAAAAILAARDPGVSALRDVDMAQLTAARGDLPILTYRRARHVIGENERVHAGLQALERHDLAAFGRLLNASHASSIENFENSSAELDILVAAGQALSGCLGARLSGGGFGGITIHLVRRHDAETYRDRLTTAFRSRTGADAAAMVCAIGEGAERYV